MRRFFIGGGVAALGFVTAALAQTVDGLDLQSIQSHAESAAAGLRDLVSGSSTVDENAKREAEALVASGFEQMRGLDAASLPKVAGGDVDLDEMLAGSKEIMSNSKAAPMFIVFVSLSMPPESLKALIDDVRRAGGAVVFRGFPNNSGKSFSAAMQKVVDKESAPNVAIDPRLFRAFNVQAAPTFVVASTDFVPCDQLDCVTKPPAHDKMVGNVSVRYALEQFVDGKGPGASVAAVALKKFEASR